MKKQSKVVRLNAIALRLAHKSFKGMDKTSENWSIALKTAWAIVKNRPTLDFNKIYSENYNRILFYINGNVKNMDISMELTNDTFLKVNDNLEYYTPELGKVTTWVYNIAKNVVIDYFRANNRRLTNTTNIENYVSEEGECFFTVTDNHVASETVENKEVNDKIMLAINSLSDKYKQVAMLHIIEEKNYSEIAEIMNISMANTKVMILRTKEKLQAQLRFEYSQI